MVHPKAAATTRRLPPGARPARARRLSSATATSRSALHQPLGRRLVAAEKIAFPARKPIDQVVVDVLRRFANEQAVPDFFAVFVLRPAIASLAERNLIPLLGLMIIAGLRKFLALPYLLDPV